MEYQACDKDDNATSDSMKVNGIIFLAPYTTSVFMKEEWENFVFKDDDILLLSYPKSGKVTRVPH